MEWGWWYVHNDYVILFSYSGTAVPEVPVSLHCLHPSPSSLSLPLSLPSLPPSLPLPSSQASLNLYPTVGLQTPGEIVEANFGESPFVFDFEGLLSVSL